MKWVKFKGNINVKQVKDTRPRCWLYSQLSEKALQPENSLLPNICDVAFCINSERLKAVNYFLRIAHFYYSHIAQKMMFSIKGFPEEILNGKLDFLCSRL